MGNILMDNVDGMQMIDLAITEGQRVCSVHVTDLHASLLGDAARSIISRSFATSLQNHLLRQSNYTCII